MTPPAEIARAAAARVIFSGLVFTMAWEDPDVDQEALRVSEGDKVLCVTSAGCNALNMLCFGPKEIVCVDSNPIQNHLMELKCAGIRTLDYEAFADLFSGRRTQHARAAYHRSMRKHLSPDARRYWDRHIGWVETGLYRRGHMGLFLRIVRGCMRGLGLSESNWESFLSLSSLAEQRAWYRANLAPKLPTRFYGPLGKGLLYLAGMHPMQLRLLEAEGPIEAIARARIEYVLTQIPIHNNYFWHMALTGRFHEPHLPPFLRPENFSLLKQTIGRVKVMTAAVDTVLSQCAPRSIDKFNLLDIFDWMDENSMGDTLGRVAGVASKRARVLFRSAVSTRGLPPDAAARWSVDAGRDATLVARDRSGTHGSVSLLTLTAQA